MALPLITSLNALQRAALPIIKSGVSKGLSSRVINEAIRVGLGSGINRNTLLKIINAEKGIQRAGTLLKFLRAGDLPALSGLPQAVTRIRRQFRFVVEIRGRILDTQEPIIQNVTVSSDVILSRGELESIGRRFVEDEQQQYGIDVDSVLLISGEQAGALGTL